MTDQHPLGRRIPTDWRHVEKYPLSALEGIPAEVFIIERVLADTKAWRLFYDQGREGACVGFASSRTMSILNRKRYDARWLWNEAKRVDEWPDTNPGDDNGTSVRAAMDVLRSEGHKRWGARYKPDQREGIAATRWATSVGDVRVAISQGMPVTLGINWYQAFDSPEQVKHSRGIDQWIARGPSRDLGPSRGGHAICCIGASDERDAVCLANSWGASYPGKVWLPYNVLGRLLDEEGEAALVTDR